MPMSEPSPIVLVVDDEIQIRRFLRTGFELNGFVVHEAGTGAVAPDRSDDRGSRPARHGWLQRGRANPLVVERADHRAVSAIQRSGKGAPAGARRGRLFRQAIRHG